MSYRHLAILSGVLAAFPLLNPASAQINCGRATTPVDKAICASPALLAQDTALVDAYRQALARMPGQTAEIREAQLRWLTERRRECGGNGGAAMEACLSQAFAARIAALTSPNHPRAAPPATPDTGNPPGLRIAAPQPRRSRPNSGNHRRAPPNPGTPSPCAPTSGYTHRSPAAPAWPAAIAATPAALPPGPAVTAPAARLQRETLPTAGQGETLLEVLQPGRFAIRAKAPPAPPCNWWTC
jgi:uncharacterized protein